MQLKKRKIFGEKRKPGEGEEELPSLGSKHQDSSSSKHQDCSSRKLQEKISGEVVHTQDNSSEGTRSPVHFTPANTISTGETTTATLTNMTEKLGLFTIVGFTIVVCQVACELCKQLSNYSIQYYNGGKYPLPQTVIVVLVELFKLAATVARFGCTIPSLSRESLRNSFKFLFPSVLYAINNNIYFAGLMLVPPPIWIILTSFRTVVTATLYKFFLKRQVTTLQFVGALCIVLSIVVAKFGDLTGTSHSSSNQIPPLAFILAAVASCNSVGAAVYTESLFKAAGENFLEQQFWLYLYGMLVAALVHVLSSANISIYASIFTLDEVSKSVQLMLLSALIFGSIGGIIVAAILKRLDNIVKEYSGATANIFTAVVCSFLFPDKFEFTVYIGLAMCLLFLGIYLYESKKAIPSSEKNGLTTTQKI